MSRTRFSVFGLTLLTLAGCAASRRNHPGTPPATPNTFAGRANDLGPLTDPLAPDGSHSPAGPDRKFNPNAFDPDEVLAGQGQWVTINEERYFAPSTYVVKGEEEWAPYRHGYWSWDESRGLTWDSYDPWGRVTDHYGVWRHHATYGWIWRPFDDRHYQPHVVTLVEAGEDIAWYPYLPGFKALYRADESLGFDDQYWLGYEIGTQLTAGSSFYGFAIVPRQQFLAANVIDIMIERRTVILPPALLPALQVSIVSRRWFGRESGDLAGLRARIEARVGRPLPVLSNPFLAVYGSGRIFNPRALYPPPIESRMWRQQLAGRTEAPPIGAVGHMLNGAYQVVAPPRSLPPVLPGPASRGANARPIHISSPRPVPPSGNPPVAAPGAPAAHATERPRPELPSAVTPAPAVQAPLRETVATPRPVVAAPERPQDALPKHERHSGRLPDVSRMQRKDPDSEVRTKSAPREEKSAPAPERREDRGTSNHRPPIGI